MPPESPSAFDIRQIVEELRELRSQQLTGTYFVVSDDNRQARIGLVDGDIVSVSYRGVEGPQALARLAAIRALRSRFAADGALHRGFSDQTALPATEALFKALLQGGAALGTASPRPVQVAAADPGERRVAELSPAEQAAIRSALTDHLGPIAGLVFDEKRDPRLGVETFLDQLAAEIPGKAQQAEFLAAVRSSVRK
jgi:hypothetical protein